MNPATVFKLSSEKAFTITALDIFKFQYQNNAVYRDFCNHIHPNPLSIDALEAIPFLPIAFFKSHAIVSGTNIPSTVFTSSGTSGEGASKHYVNDINWYQQSYQNAFSYFYGNVTDYCVLALLPSYLEREGSSLIFMVDDLIQKSKHPQSGFYLNDHKKLASLLTQLDAAGTKVLLIGVSFALLDLVERYQFQLKNTIVMETGGMKGRRKELIRSELHEILRTGFGLSSIHSEYGMTELLSQAYSYGNGVFKTPPWMKVLIRDPEDPLAYETHGKTGGINVIDLANYNSCSFIATQDLGKVHKDSSFEVLGRFDHSDIRGCNLMVL